MKKVKLKIGGMHCASCAMSIDGELEDTKGVSEAKTSYARQVADISYDPGEISIDQIISKIREIDTRYDAVKLTEE